MADPEVRSPVVGSSKPRLLDVLGPGLITGASDDDPSGIATYSQAGAQFGYGLNWVMLLTLPLMVSVQMISARIGRTTGRGLARNLRDHYPAWLLRGIVFAVVIANTINIGADLGAMADAVRQVAGGPAWVYLLGFGLLSVLLQVFMQYTRYVAILKWLSAALFAYVVTLLMVHVDWAEAGKRLVVPQFQWSKDYVTLIVAVLGTTISPYLFFWQAAQEAEDVREIPRRQRLTRAPHQARAAFRRIETDTVVGMAFSNLVALAIMITTAATLGASGVTNIESSAQAAEALRPIAGPYASTLFALGIVGTGILAIPVLAGSAAYALGEAMRWKTGLAMQWFEARSFYATVAFSTLVGMAMDFSPLDPIKALFWSAVVNGVVAVPVMAVMMVVARSPRAMGKFAIGGKLLAAGWIATALMGAAAAAMLVSLVL
ncbi:Nramp family divalent metal transporter [Alsobacter soli]|nr:Nramp family divalent metal transporter [Alsobacter soli]